MLSDLIGSVGILVYNQGSDKEVNEWSENALKLFEQWKEAAREGKNTVVQDLGLSKIIRVRIEVCAVFDTVSSIGPPITQAINHERGLHNTIGARLHPAVRVGLQALAIRENRPNFKPWI